MKSFRRKPDASGPAPPMRVDNHKSGPTTAYFVIPVVEAHTDIQLELNVGKESVNVAVMTPTFHAFFDGLGPVPTQLEEAAAMTLYANLDPCSRVANYRWQEEVEPFSKTYHSARDRVAADRRTKPEAVPLWGISCVKGLLYLAVFSPIKLANVKIPVRIGDRLCEYDDARSPWRISRMYVCSSLDYDVVIAWLQANRTRLILKSLELTQPVTNQNLLHVVCGAVGDVKLARLYLEYVGRFLHPEAEDERSQTPIMKLLERRDIYDTHSPRYFRALELVELFVGLAGVTLDHQDVDGNTITHYAARGHTQDSKILPYLIKKGAPVDVVNAAGRSPVEECMLPEYGLLPSDYLEAEKLVNERLEDIAERGANKFIVPVRKLRSLDSLPPMVNGSSHADAEDSAALSIGNTNAPSSSSADGKSNTPVVVVLPSSATDKSAVSVGARNLVPDLVTKDADGLPVADGTMTIAMENELRAEFAYYDKSKTGYLTVAEMRGFYNNLETFGVVESVGEVEKLVSGMGLNRDGKLTFDEFALLMIRLNER